MELLFRNCIIHKVNPILRLRGGYLSKDQCGDFLPYVNTSNTLWRVYYSKTYLWHFQKTIVKIPCLMSTQADMMETIVQKFNPIVHHEQ